jgi:hypothetical protein
MPRVVPDVINTTWRTRRKGILSHKANLPSLQFGAKRLSCLSHAAVKKSAKIPFFLKVVSDAESRRFGADAHVGKPAQEWQFLPLTGE